MLSFHTQAATSNKFGDANGTTSFAAKSKAVCLCLGALCSMSDQD